MLWTDRYNQDFSTIYDNKNLKSIYLESNEFDKEIILPNTLENVEFWFNRFSKSFKIEKCSESIGIILTPFF